MGLLINDTEISDAATLTYACLGVIASLAQTRRNIFENRKFLSHFPDGNIQDLRVWFASLHSPEELSELGSFRHHFVHGLNNVDHATGILTNTYYPCTHDWCKPCKGADNKVQQTVRYECSEIAELAERFWKLSARNLKATLGVEKIEK